MSRRGPLRGCLHCGRPFHPSKRTALYCRPLCRQEARRVRRDGQRYYARKQREREMKPIACAVCGHEMMFSPTRSTRRYCSNACRQYAYRHRQPSAAQIKARIDRGMRRRDRFARAARMRSHRPLAPVAASPRKRAYGLRRERERNGLLPHAHSAGLALSVILSPVNRLPRQDRRYRIALGTREVVRPRRDR